MIRLQEWKPSGTISLSAKSHRILKKSLGHRLEMHPEENGWTLRAKGIVGRIVLPEGTLDLQPKYPIQSLCRMIAAVAGIPKLFNDTAELGDGSLPDLLVAGFVQRTEALLAESLRRDYVERRERLPVLRGRLDLPAHLRRPQELVTDLSCRHEDYTFDTPFNAVLRQTAEACHSRWPSIATRLLRIRHRLAGLPNSRLRPEDIDRFRYDRLTEVYRPVHALCRWILAGTSLGLETQHSAPGATFIIEMAPLFERFVSLALQARLRPPWHVKLQQRVALDQSHAIELRPDVVVYCDDRPVAILDAKYKVRDRDGVPENADAYQLLAYARRFGVKRVWLVYPDTPTGEQVLVTHDGENELVSVGIDLSATWDKVEAEFDQLAAKLRASARGYSSSSA